MATAFMMGRQWGWLSVNDIRRMLNLESIGPSGEIYLQPLNMIDVNKEPEVADAIKAEVSRLIELKGSAV